MCDLFSCIITQDRILYDLMIDSHEDIIREFELDDTTLNPEFARIEILPIDSDIFNHNIYNWKIRIDQDLIPGWFDIDNYKIELYNILQNIVFKKLFLIDYKEDFFTIKKGRLFVKNSNVEGYGSCNIECYDTCNVRGFDSCNIEGCGSCNITGFDTCKIRGFEHCIIEGHGSCNITGFDTCKIRGYEHCIIEGFGSCNVEGHGYCNIKKYSNNVKINTILDKSIVIDYNNNTITTNNNFKIINI